MKVIRQSVLFILVVAAPLYAGAQLPPASNFPAGADPFAGQRPQNGLSQADQRANAQFQRQMQARMREIDRQLQENAAEVAKRQKALDALKKEREEKGANLPQEFTEAQDSIKTQRGDLELNLKEYQATSNVLKLIGDPKDVFGDGSPTALSAAKEHLKRVVKASKALASAALKVAEVTDQAKAWNDYGTAAEQITREHAPTARGVAALNAQAVASAEPIKTDIRLWVGYKINNGNAGGPTTEAHGTEEGAPQVTDD